MPKMTAKYRGGRIRKPNLDEGPMTRIGTVMLTSVKDRIRSARNANDAPAKKLSVRWAIIKGSKLRTNRPKRDMIFTGMTMENFRLRKAINGVIRAEPTSRAARLRARRSQTYEDMIGFSGKDTVTTLQEAQKQYGDWCKKAWMPLG